MRLLKRLIPLILIISTVFTSLVSCGDRDYDEAEVKAAAETLIRKSAILEDILFGEGLDHHIEGTLSYQIVSEDDIKRKSEAMGESFSTVDELKVILSKVYTVGYKNDLLSGILSGDVNQYTRYYQNGEKMMKLVTYDVKKKDEIEYHYDTLKVKDVEGEKITVSLDITITTDDGKSQRITIDVDMIEEPDGWKLDTPTYAVYNENYQNYKDLENELNKR